MIATPSTRSQPSACLATAAAARRPRRAGHQEALGRRRAARACRRARGARTAPQRSLERRIARSQARAASSPWPTSTGPGPRSIDRDRRRVRSQLDFLDERTQRRARRPAGPRQDDDRPEHRAPGRRSPGHTALFITAAQLLLDLGAQDSLARPRPPAQALRRSALLVIDEIGYLSYDSRNADLLFQVVSRRYEKKSLVLTTNLAFSDWPTIFPNADLRHRAHRPRRPPRRRHRIEGESYRLREAKEHAGRRAPSPRDDGVPKNKKK